MCVKSEAQYKGLDGPYNYLKDGKRHQKTSKDEKDSQKTAKDVKTVSAMVFKLRGQRTSLGLRLICLLVSVAYGFYGVVMMKR